MDNQKYLKDIRLKLETYLAHIKRLQHHPEKIHSLDIDFLKAKSRDIYEILYRIELDVGDEENETSKIEEPIMAAEVEKTVEPVVEEEEARIEEHVEIETVTVPESIETEEPPEKLEDLPNKTPEVEIEPAIEIKLSVEEDKVIENETEIQEEQTRGPEKIVVETEEEKPSYVSAIDLFSNTTETTVADTFESTDDATIGTKIQKSAIQDIRQGIGINEKFLYVNELFNGDLGRYNKAIDEFNELNTKQGVDAHLVELKVQNQWTDENEAFVKFKSLLERKNN